jgi:hypothetical protein
MSRYGGGVAVATPKARHRDGGTQHGVRLRGSVRRRPGALSGEDAAVGRPSRRGWRGREAVPRQPFSRLPGCSGRRTQEDVDVGGDQARRVDADTTAP